ncbi:hypothetical protein R6Z07F_010140 [Ovis aries]
MESLIHGLTPSSFSRKCEASAPWQAPRSGPGEEAGAIEAHQLTWRPGGLWRQANPGNRKRRNNDHNQYIGVPWTARRSNQSILKEISPGISLEGMMLKLKLQYFGHLMRRADSLEKTLMLGGIEGRRRRG